MGNRNSANVAIDRHGFRGKAPDGIQSVQGWPHPNRDDWEGARERVSSCVWVEGKPLSGPQIACCAPGVMPNYTFPVRWAKTPKLPLPAPPNTFFAEQRQNHNIVSLPLGEADLSPLADLPPLHRDPFDRVLICQALVHGLTLVTVDTEVRAYPVALLTEM
jgi:hypothetical protein